MSYNVHIPVFEGPFDLLLHLVRVNEMDIYDISISEIASRYLDAIREMERLDLDMAGDFLVMAATLINLKSRTLMPPSTPEQAAEEEEENQDEADEQYQNIRNAQDLMQRLIEYRQFKELAARLSDREEAQLRLFYRNNVLPAMTNGGHAGDDLREDISLLFSAFARVLEFAERRPTHHVVEEEFSTEERIETISRLLASKRRLSVSELLTRCLNKQEAITTFLAMLEICRLKRARVRQTGNFESIELVAVGEEDDDED